MSNPVHLPLTRITAAIDRELGMRRRVYPKRIADSKMTVAQAAEETLNMQAAKDTLTTAVALLKRAEGAMQAKGCAPGVLADVQRFLETVSPKPAQGQLFDA